MTPFLTTLILMALLALPGFVAIRLSGYFFGAAEWWRRGFAAACLYPVLIWFVLMIQAPVGLVSLWPMLICMLILAAICLVIPAVAWRFDPTDGTGWQPRWQLALGAGLVTAAMMVFVYSNYVTGVQFMSDDFAYHGPTIAAWFRTGTLEHPRIMFPAYYPFNAHMITLYTVFPTGDLRWTWLATFFWLVLGCGAILHITRCLPRFTLAWGLIGAAVFLVCSEVAFYHFYTLSPNDVSGAVAFLIAFVVAIPRVGAPPREALARVALAAMLIGFAMGTKATFAVPGVVGGFGVLFMTLLGPSPFTFGKRLATSVGLLALGAFSTGSYWYLWNWIVARNPVFPAQVLNFRGPGNDKSWGDSKLVYHIEHADDSGIWWEIIRQTLNFPTVIGVLSLIGLTLCAGFIGWLIRSALTSKSPVPLGHPMIWMFVAGLPIMLLYPFMPFTGSFITNDLIINHRYFLYSFLIGVVTFCWAFSSIHHFVQDTMTAKVINGAVFVAASISILYALYLNSFTLGSTQEIPALITGLIVAVGILLLPTSSSAQPFTPTRRALALTATGACALFLVAGTFREVVLPPPYMKLLDIPATQPVKSIINAIDELPPGSRIGEFSMNGWEYMYLCGSRFQHEPVLLWEQGPAMVPLHEAYYARMIDLKYPRLGIPREGEVPNPDTFTERFREVELDYVLVTLYLQGLEQRRWPEQRAFIQQMHEYELVWSDDYSEIYKRVPNPSNGAVSTN